MVSRKKRIIKHTKVVWIIASVVIATVFMTVATHAQTITNSLASLFQNIPITTAINPNDTSSSNWKSITSNRKTITVTYKFPSEWKSIDDNCVIPSGYKGLSLPPGCAKITIFTDNLPRALKTALLPGEKLLSETKTTVQGYTVIRDLYSTTGSDTIPNSYEAWFYDQDQPFMLVAGFIAAGTDIQTTNYLISVFDKGVGSLQFQRK